MSKQKTKAEILAELDQAYKRIAELEAGCGHQTEDRFATIFRISSSPMALTDVATGKYVEVNDAFLDVVGLDREDVIGSTALELGLFSEPAQRTDLLRRLERQGNSRNEKVLVHCRSGDVRQGVFAAEYIHEPNRELLLTLMNDVTGRVQAEEQLDVFFSQSLDGFFFMMLDEPVRWDDTVDKERTLDYVFGHQRITRVNDAMLEQYRARREDFLGKTPQDFFAHDLTQGRKVWRRFFDEGRLHVDTHEQKFDGSPMWIEGDYLCLYDALGRIAGHFGIQRDITERRTMENALRESEERWQFALEGAGDGVWDYNAQTNTVFYSHRWKSMLGYDDDDISDSRDEWKSRIHPDDVAAVLEATNKHIEGRAPSYACEYRIRCKDGSYQWILDSGKVIKWADDHSPLRIIGTNKDISERKAAEEKLRASEERHRALVDTLDIGLSRWLPDTTLTYANQRIKQLNPGRYGEVGIQWIDTLSVEERALVTALLKEVLEHPRTVTYENQIWTQEGSVRTYQWITTPIVDEHGRVVEFQTIGIDITERKHAELVLAESEARLEGLLDATPDAMIISNAEGKILRANAETEAMFGYSHSELLDVAIEDLIPASLRTGHVRDRTVYMRQPRPMTTGIHRPILARSKDGREFPVEISLSHYKIPDGETVVLSTVRDVTDRKRAERLIAAQRDLTRLANATQTDDATWGFCLETALHVSELDSGGIYLLNEHSRAFELVCHMGLGSAFINDVAQIDGDSPNAQWVHIGKTFLFSAPQLAPQTLYRAEGIHALIAIPIQHHGQVLGCLNVASHTLESIPDFARSALEAIAMEIGNIIIHQRTEESLRASRVQLAQTLTAAHMGLWTYSYQTRQVELSPEATRLLGLAVAPDDYASFLSIVHPDDRATAMFSLQSIFSLETEPQGLEYRLVDGQGKTTWVASYAHIERDDSGRAVMISGLVHDITERKRAEEKLRESEEKYRALINGMNESVWVIDFDTRILDVNNTATVTLGYTRDELLTMSIPDIDAALTAEQIQALVSNLHIDKIQVFETWHTTKDGRKIPVEVSSSLVSYMGRTAIMSIGRDISDRKRAEEQLRISEARFATMFRSSPSPIALARLSDNKIIDVNAAWEKIAGWPKESVVGKTPHEVNAWVQESKREEMKALVAEHGVVHGFDMQMRTRDGSIKDMLLSAEVIDVQGEPCLLSMSQDITERKRVEEELRASEEKFSKAFMVSPDAIIISDLASGRYVDVNESFLRESGYERSEVIGFASLEMALWANPEDYHRVMADLRSFGSVHNIGVQYKRKSGEVREALVSAELIELGRRGKHILAVVRDVTDLKVAFEQIRESESHYRLLAENITDVIWVVDVLERRFRYVSPSVTQLLGFSVEELVTKDVAFTLRSVSAQSFTRMLDSRLEEFRRGVSKVYTDEIEQLRSDGSTVWVEITTHAIINPETGQTEIYGVSRDITERKRVQDELARTERRYRALIENAPDGIVLLDANGLFQFGSPSAYRTFDYTPEETIGLRALTWVHPEDAPRLNAQFLALFDEPAKSFTMDYRFKDSHGTYLWIEGHFKNLVDDPAVNAVVNNFRDITERKRMEDEILLSEARYRSLVETQSDLIARSDLSGKLSYVNDAFCRTIGLPREKLLGQHLQTFIVPDDLPAVSAASEAILSPPHHHYSETRHFTVDGIRWFGWNSSAVRDDEGRVVEWQGTGRDITERKQGDALQTAVYRIAEAAQASESLEELYPVIHRWVRTIMRANNFYISLHEPQPERLKFVYYEHETEDDTLWIPSDAGLTGYVLQTGQSLLIHPEHPEVDIAIIGPLSKVWLGVPLRVFGRVIGVMAVEDYFDENAYTGRDLRLLEFVSTQVATAIDRKRAEIALRESEEKYRSLLASLESVVATVDESGRFIYLNETAARQLGSSAEMLIGKTMHELFPEPDASRQLESVRRVIHEDRSFVRETVVQLQSNERWHRMTFQPVHDHAGSVASVLINSVDIHDLKMTQQELLQLNHTLEERVRERTAQVQDLYDNAPVGYHSLDSEGCLIAVNQTEMDWLGYTREEMLGNSFDHFLASEYAQSFQERFDQFKKMGEAVDSEVVVRRKDGSTFAVLINATAVYDQHGQYVSSRSTMLDITRRKAAESELKRNVNFTNTLLEAIPTPVFYLDRDGFYQGCNRAFTHIVGLTPEQIRGKKVYELWPGELSNAYYEQDTETIQEQERVSYESTVVDNEGKLHPVIFAKDAFFDEDGKVAGLVCAFVDITDRKQAEEVLRESEEHNRLLFEESPDAVVLFDEGGRVVRANHAFESLVGIARDQLVGHSLSDMDLLTRQHVEQLASATLHALQQRPDSAEVEFSLGSSAGASRDVSAHTFALYLEGRLHYLTTMRDITAEKQAEAALLRALEQQKELNDLKSRFISMTSHEFRTPLTTILSSTELLELYGDRWPEDKKQVHHHRIKNAVTHMTRLLEDVLILGRVEAGRLAFHPAPLDLLRFCHAMVEELQLSAREKHNFEFVAKGDCDRAYMDEKLLRQILGNLLSNAIKYSPQRGLIRLTLDCQGGWATFAVQDDGIGIPEEAQARLFETFYRAPNVSAIPGTGLGLAIVKRTVELHGGTITFTSTVGHGAIFRVTLPIGDEEICKRKAL